MVVWKGTPTVCNLLTVGVPYSCPERIGATTKGNEMKWTTQLPNINDLIANIRTIAVLSMIHRAQVFIAAIEEIPPWVLRPEGEAYYHEKNASGHGGMVLQQFLDEYVGPLSEAAKALCEEMQFGVHGLEDSACEVTSDEVALWDLSKLARDTGIELGVALGSLDRRIDEAHKALRLWQKEEDEALQREQDRALARAQQSMHQAMEGHLAAMYTANSGSSRE